VTPRAARFISFVLLVLGGAVSQLLNAYGDDIPTVHTFFSFKGGCVEDALSDCFGLQAVFRISFALMFYFGINMVCSFFVEGFHLGAWGLKGVIWALLILISFFIPYDFFQVYVQVARGFSLLFLVIQIIVLIDLAYKAHEVLAERFERKHAELEREYAQVGACQNQWKILYLIVVLGLITASCAVLFWLFTFVRTNHFECGRDKFFLSVTFILGVVIVLMSATRYFGSRGTVAPAVMFAYCSWMVWSAMCSEPAEGCAPIDYDGSAKWATATSIILALASLAWFAYSASSSVPGMEKAPEPAAAGTATSHSATSPLLDEAAHKADSEKADASGAAAPASAAAAPVAHERYWVFHLVMAMGSMYMAMILSNWQVDATTAQYTTNTVSLTTMWLKIGAQWIAFALFFWTLIAPRLFPDRDFR